jgi:hypothetical protein
LIKHWYFKATGPGCDFSFLVLLLLRENGVALMSTLKNKYKRKTKVVPLTMNTLHPVLMKNEYPV